MITRPFPYSQREKRPSAYGENVRRVTSTDVCRTYVEPGAVVVNGRGACDETKVSRIAIRTWFTDKTRRETANGRLIRATFASDHVPSNLDSFSPKPSAMENNERDEFYKKLESYYTYKPGKKPYTIDEMNTMIQDLINAKTNRLVKTFSFLVLPTHSSILFPFRKKKTRHEYYLLEKYDVLSVADKRYLKCKNKKEEETK